MVYAFQLVFLSKQSISKYPFSERQVFDESELKRKSAISVKSQKYACMIPQNGCIYLHVQNQYPLYYIGSCPLIQTTLACWCYLCTLLIYIACAKRAVFFTTWTFSKYQIHMIYCPIMKWYDRAKIMNCCYSLHVHCWGQYQYQCGGLTFKHRCPSFW